MRKQLSVLPFLGLAFKHLNNNTSSKAFVQKFNILIKENDPYSNDYILTNWMAYKALKNSEYEEDSGEYLENAYLEIKSKSKNIKNKKDRNKFLKTKLHTKIVSTFKNS